MEFTIYDVLKFNPFIIKKILANKDKYYKIFIIKQRNGKTRQITAPVRELKVLQKNILKSLLEKMEYSKFAKAYTKQKSIKDNANFHQKQALVICLDIKNFFDNIHFNSVKDVFQKISIGEAEILAEICTYHGKLPQGGVTSPYLSNLIMEPIDKKISNFCFKYDLNYTRYADDITISTHLLSKNERERFVKLVIENINNILSEYSFTLNEKKIKVQYAYQQQRVTGIIVNNTMQVPKEYRMKIRQEIYYIKKYGLNSHLMRNHQEKQKYINILKGKINYVLFVNPKDEKMKEYLHYIENHLRY